MSVDELNDSISQYTAQLNQIAQALQHTKDESERSELEKLKLDLTELLNLTQETLVHSKDEAHSVDELKGNAIQKDSATADPIDDEFALFMREIKQLDPSEQTESVNEDAPEPESDSSEELDLDGLLGSKCSAPHLHTWGSTVYHNAMVCSLDSSNLAEATAKVLFTNPTHREMIPCAYFLDGDCRFTDEKCHYSHGEVVRLDQLRDYREPQFEQLRRKGSLVLVKQSSRLWCKGTVLEVNFEGKRCKIRLEEGKREQAEVPFEDLLPLDEHDGSDAEEDHISASEEDSDEEALRRAQMVEKSLFHPAPDRRLGEWEEHTCGIGSKIMQKMGYVVGTGLGREGEGIVIPVSAQVLPQGRSLDYCMELREQANGDKDLFSVEKKLVQLKKQQEKRAARDYERRSKADKAKDVFSFINEQVFNGGGESSKAKRLEKHTATEINGRELKEHTSKNLNIASLKLSEEIRRAEAEVERLKIALTRHKVGTPASDNLRRQIDAKRAEISRLQASEYNISKEQQLRSDKRKMTVF
uniref:Zinc finger CCCH-type with G patch domain-containing protein n=1 Tax=Anopheles farauti TaxID=69004 RepID=A0A182Q6B9_9DIPT